MTFDMNSVVVRKWVGLGLLTLIIVGLVFALVARNASTVDAFLGRVIQYSGWSRSSNPVAVYDSCHFIGTGEYFYEFSSGYGVGRFADVKVQFPDGQVYPISEIPSDAVRQHVGETLDPVHEKDIEQYYRSGFDRYSYRNNQLLSVRLREDCGLKLDFGDGVFRSLPIDYEELFAIFGKPKKWGKSTSPLP